MAEELTEKVVDLDEKLKKQNESSYADVSIFVDAFVLIAFCFKFYVILIPVKLLK